MMYIKVTDQDTGATYTFENTKADGGLLSRIEGFMYPSVNASIEDVAGARSAVPVNSKFGQRLMSWAYNITCDVLETRRAILAAMRQSATPKLIEFETLDGLALKTYGYVTKVSSVYKTQMTNAIYFEVRAADWRFYSQALQSNHLDPNVNEIVNNAGTELTPPVFTITGPGNDIEVVNLTTGESFEIGNLSAGEVVVIDTDKHTVTLDGDPAASIFVGDFFSLAPGNNDLDFLVPTGSDGNTDLLVEWEHAYNGV